MERRSWPWKRKSSVKGEADHAIPTSDFSGVSAGSLVDQDNCKKPKHVQISVESYSHLIGLEYQVKTYEDQVKTLEDHVKELNEKLSAAQTEITDTDTIVKQHAKVAEEAVSGWEKAEAEALMLKNQLESVTLLKLTAEDRSSHLDDALKQCMRQIRNLNDEHEQKLHEVVLIKTKQCDKIKLELEAKLGNLDEKLLSSEAENAALSRLLQERSNMLVNISEEKSQAEAEIELLESNIESCEREMNSLKYELHVITKEVEIRNEEKNMSVRSAEVANKHHLEGAKKIAKLEAECQRLRVLVKKKLPGPAALAQMKLEVGRDYGERGVRRSPVRSSSPRAFQVPGFSLDSYQKFHTENDFLTDRVLAMEEETKMLKEALAKRNSELQASSNIFAETVTKLQSLELQLQAKNQQKSPSKSNLEILTEGSFVQNASSPPSLTSVSEDGNDDEGSCAGSWATVLIKREKNVVEKSSKSENENQLELMDDFLEMEKLVNESNGDVSGSENDNFESTAASWKCSLEEFEELKRENDNLVLELGRCSENLESTKTRLQETEQKLVEFKSQLASAQKSNSLAETQLKCMAESYKSLETWTDELQIEVNRLQGKMGSLNNELQEERNNHHDTLAKCKVLQEQLKRNESCAVADVDVKTSQESDIAAAAEKLAECQETIFILGKQLNTMRPQTELMGSPHNKRSQKGDGSTEEEPTPSGFETNPKKMGGESPNTYSSPFSPSTSTEAFSPLQSPISSKHLKHRTTNSVSSSSSSNPTPEKHSRGISRFFSSKSRNGNQSAF